MVEIQNELILLTGKTLEGLKQTEAGLQKVDDSVKKVGETSKVAFSGKDITDYRKHLKDLNSELEGQKQIIKQTQTAINDMGNTNSKQYKELKQDLTSAKRLQSEIKEEIKQATQAQKQHQKALEDTNTVYGKMMDTFKKLGTLATAIYALDKIKEFGIESVKMYLEADKNEKLLSASLGIRKGLTQDLILFAKELQSSSILPKDEIIRQEQYLAVLGLSEQMIKKVIQTAADWSSKDPFTSFDSAVRQLSATLEKGTWEKGLAKIIGNFKDSGLTEEMVKTGAAVDLLANKFKNGAKEISETDFGFVEKQKNQLKEIREEVGKVIFAPIKGAWQSFVNDFLAEIPFIKGALKDAGLDLFISSSQTTRGILEANKFYNALVTNKKLTTGEIIQQTKDEYNKISKLDDDYSKAYAGQLQERLKVFNDSVITGIRIKNENDDKQAKKDKKLAEERKKTRTELEQFLKDQDAENFQRGLKDRDLDLNKTIQLYDKKIQEAAGFNDIIIELERRKIQAILALNREWDKKELDADNQKLTKIKQNIDEIIKKSQESQEKELDLIEKASEKKGKEYEKDSKKQIKITEETQKTIKKWVEWGSNESTNIIGLMYDKQQILDDNAKMEEIRKAGDNQEKIKEINNRYAEKEKQRKADQARINSYLAAVSALATADNIYAGLILAGAAIVEGEMYAENIEATNVQQYNKGVDRVPGPSGVDRIPAMLTKDEGVMDAEHNLKHLDLMNAIRNDEIEDYIQKAYVLPTLNKLLIQDVMKRVEQKEEFRMANLFNIPINEPFSDYDLKCKLNETNLLLSKLLAETKSKNNQKIR